MAKFTRHPHADAIIAWAEGETIQERTHPGEQWQNCSPWTIHPFYQAYEYRIAPKPVMIRHFTWDNNLNQVFVLSKNYSAIEDKAIKHWEEQAASGKSFG